ncbi:hypothetical protein BY996DRAFT_1143277 [Phakopsora pachyrhizi]|nr:hypothetical protein BY996DRAFT_1143277 [Phakopsora pachyrhizi]
MLDWQEKENIYQARIASLIETLRQSTDRPYTFTEPISFNDDESFNQSVSSSYERGDEEERYLTTPRTSSSISRNSENTSESVNNRPDDQVVVSGDDAGDPSETIDLAVLVSSYVETIESMEVTILDLNSELEDLNRAYQALISHQRFHQDNLTEATDRHYIDQNSLEGEEDYRGSVGSVSEETGRTSWAETIDKKSIVRRIKQFEMIEGDSGEFKEILNDEDHYNESIENQRVKSLMVEIYELRETNRKLNDYLSKILCRIIGLEAFEVVLNRDFDILKIKKSSSSSSNGKKKILKNK